MIFWMPRSEDTLDYWSIVHLTGGLIIGGISAIWVSPFSAMIISSFFGFLYECRDAWYANAVIELNTYGRFYLGRRLGAYWGTNCRIYKIIFWMADGRGASVWDIAITAFGGLLCGLIVHLL